MESLRVSEQASEFRSPARSTRGAANVPPWKLRSTYTSTFGRTSGRGQRRVSAARFRDLRAFAGSPFEVDSAASWRLRSRSHRWLESYWLSDPDDPRFKNPVGGWRDVVREGRYRRIRARIFRVLDFVSRRIWKLDDRRRRLDEERSNPFPPFATPNVTSVVGPNTSIWTRSELEALRSLLLGQLYNLVRREDALQGSDQQQRALGDAIEVAEDLLSEYDPAAVAEEEINAGTFLPD